MKSKIVRRTPAVLFSSAWSDIRRSVLAGKAKILYGSICAATLLCSFILVDYKVSSFSMK